MTAVSNHVIDGRHSRLCGRKFLTIPVFGSAILIWAQLVGFSSRISSLFPQSPLMIESLLSHQNESTPFYESSNESKPFYQSSSAERYMLDNAMALGYNMSSRNSLKPTCPLWTDQKLPVHYNLSQYLKELTNYTKRVGAFKPIQDLRLSLHENHDICDTVDLDLPAIFPSQQLSFGSSFGAIEPMLPPFRHPDICANYHKSIFNMNYMVHDFAQMCRRLKPTSRTILVDMGASLEFHGGRAQPAIYLTNLYRKFGFPFDHIYAYEVSPKTPQQVFKAVPEKLLAAYHWINLGVESDPKSKMNPLRMLLDNYNEDDLIVVKLDIDTPSIELPLAMQLLKDERYTGLIDHFYFEHHVNLKELVGAWGASVNGSVLDSINLFMGLREKGIAAHSWV